MCVPVRQQVWLKRAEECTDSWMNFSFLCRCVHTCRLAPVSQLCTPGDELRFCCFFFFFQGDFPSGEHERGPHLHHQFCPHHHYRMRECWIKTCWNVSTTRSRLHFSLVCCLFRSNPPPNTFSVFLVLLCWFFIRGGLELWFSFIWVHLWSFYCLLYCSLTAPLC